MPTLLEAAHKRKAELEAAEQRKQEAERLKNEAAAKAAVETKATVPVVKRAYTPRAPVDEPEEIDATPGGYVPNTDALRVAAKMLTGKTVRGSGADARRAIAQWNGKIPKARRQP